MKVTNININETDSISHKHVNWLDYWSQFSGEELPGSCQEKSCSNKPEVGCVVQKNSSTDRNYYILPLCDFHNDKKGEKLRVRNTVNLVSVNVGEVTTDTPKT